MRKAMIIWLAIYISYMTWLGCLTITYEKDGRGWEFKYHGLLWVILDWYSIIRWQSDDTPMSQFELRDLPPIEE